MGQHDLSYRLFFTHRRMIQDLLREIVGERWVERIDVGSGERVDASFVSPRHENRESDVIWRFRRKDGGEPVYVYVLLELQSDVQRFMAVRLMAYVALLYQDLLKRGELTPDGRLPLVIPLVIYNGEAGWWAPQELSELIEPFDPAAEALVPRLRYRVIDEGAYSAEELERREGLAALLFWLKTQQGKAMVQAPRRLKQLLAREGDPSMYRAFLIWLGYITGGFFLLLTGTLGVIALVGGWLLGGLVVRESWYERPNAKQMTLALVVLFLQWRPQGLVTVRTRSLA